MKVVAVVVMGRGGDGNSSISKACDTWCILQGSLQLLTYLIFRTAYLIRCCCFLHFQMETLRQR